MTPRLFQDIALAPALRLLPDVMDSPEARAMVIAICLQESELKHRMQMGGPARGYAQFERGGGVYGVLTHSASLDFAHAACKALDIEPESYAVHEAMAFNDILACVFARLLLWTTPMHIPRENESHRAWKMYLSTWRPGKPRPEKWAANFLRAWRVVHDEE